MYFQIDPPGSDYTRVQLDVPNGQLEEIVRVVTTLGAQTEAGGAAGLTPIPPWDDLMAAANPPMQEASWHVPGWLWDLLTSDARAQTDPQCHVCGRQVSFRERKAASGAVCAVDHLTREVRIACRRCAGEGRAQTLTDVLRPLTPESVLGGDLLGVRLPTVVGEVQVVRRGDVPTHFLLAPLVESHRRGSVEGGRRHGGGADPDHLLKGGAVRSAVLQPEATAPMFSASPGEAEQETDVEVGAAVEAELNQGRADRDVEGDRVVGHGCSSEGCRCAGAARPDGAGEAEPTKTESLLEEAVELLKSVALSVAPPVIRFPENAAFTGRVKPEDLSRGVWSIPADDMGVSFAGTTVADEDACRRVDDVDDVDQDGPDCEGPEGGESA